MSIKGLELLKTSFYDESSFESNDEKVLLFTGLPTFALFSTLLSFLLPYLPKTKKLSNFHHLLFTLMCLRLNVSTKCISFLFQIPNASASRIMRDMVNIMSVRLKFLVKWPERSALQKTMPMQFRKHFGKKCAVIIDCFKVFTDRLCF